MAIIATPASMSVAIGKDIADAGQAEKNDEHYGLCRSHGRHLSESAVDVDSV
jgi:hypothetical protein